MHNLLRDGFLKVNNKSYYDFDSNDTMPINNIIALAKTGGYANVDGFEVRDGFMEYFNSNESQVPWQLTRVRRIN